MRREKVLAITKRTAELCATQGILYGAGFELVTATSLNVAHAVINSVSIKGVIICQDSWSDEERASIASELERTHPELAVVMRCPGCTGCDEAKGCPGTILDALPLTKLMTEIERQH